MDAHPVHDAYQIFTVGIPAPFIVILVCNPHYRKEPFRSLFYAEMDDPLTAGPFEGLLAWPQGLNVEPDPLTVDWDAMKRGDVTAVGTVVEAWRLAAEQGHLYGHVWPYNGFYVKVDGKWERAVHLDRAWFWLLDRKREHPSLPDGYSWRHTTSPDHASASVHETQRS